MTRSTAVRRAFTGLLDVIATSRLHSVAVVLGVAATGCVEQEPAVSELSSESTVSDYVYNGCSTAVVIGLSKQIAEQANCQHPGNFVSFGATNGITFSSNAVLPYLSTSARDDLQAVAASHPIQINSALRTLAQQYLLYRWYVGGRCGVTVAAPVGHSNHEGGRAVDLADWSTRVTTMGNNGWSHDVPGDPVHFDHLGSIDHRGEDVYAFQTLWNANNPNDQIPEDGSYGAQTEARLKMSPATGFDIGPSCSNGQFDANVVSVDGADQVPPQARAHYTITLKNTGTTDWPAGTELKLATDTASPLYDTSWTSATVITTIGASIAAGAMGTVEFDVMTPAEMTDTPISEQLQLDNSGTDFGMFTFALTVVPGQTGPTSGDGNDEGNFAGDVAGGCDAGGGGYGWLLVLGVLATVARRRPRVA
jgi:hypothetical protein